MIVINIYVEYIVILLKTAESYNGSLLKVEFLRVTLDINASEIFFSAQWILSAH